MSLNVSQAEAIEAIMNQCQSRIENAANVMDVQAVVRGDRHEGPTPDRTVWLFEDIAQCSYNRGLTETWSLVVHIVAIVAGGTAQERKARASEIASTCMSTLTDFRRLDLDFVQDVKKLRMQFSPPQRTRNKLLSAVAGVMQVTFNIREKGA